MDTTEKTYTGGCHCKKVRFEVKLEIKEATMCNCSICGSAGWMLAFTPADDFKLLTGQESLVDYQFGKKTLHHTFCGTCGIRSFSRGPDKTGKEWCAINLRCLDGLDTTSVPIKHFDGRAL